MYRWHNYISLSCVLLANPSILSYWLIVYASVLCVYYMYMQILNVYGCMSQCAECLYHFNSFISVALCSPHVMASKRLSNITCLR